MKTTLLIMAAGIGSRFGTGIKQLEPVDYAFQDINDIPGTLPEGRTKPWGTGQAVLAAKKVNNPVPVSLLSGDRKPQIRFLGNHHSGSGNLYHKSFRM